MPVKIKDSKTKQIFTRKKILLLVVVLVVACSGCIYLLSTRNDTDSGTVNLNPPTPEESSAGNSAKKAAVEQQRVEENQQTSPGKKEVTPLITYAGQYGSQIEVGAYVSTIFEDGGTCTLTLERSSVTKITTVSGVKNVNSVDCPTMSIERSQLSAGQWKAIVSYSSTSSQGTSEPKYFEVR